MKPLFLLVKLYMWKSKRLLNLLDCFNKKWFLALDLPHVIRLYSPSTVASPSNPHLNRAGLTKTNVWMVLVGYSWLVSIDKKNHDIIWHHHFGIWNLHESSLKTQWNRMDASRSRDFWRFGPVRKKGCLLYCQVNRWGRFRSPLSL